MNEDDFSLSDIYGQQQPQQPRQQPQQQPIQTPWSYQDNLQLQQNMQGLASVDAEIAKGEITAEEGQIYKQQIGQRLAPLQAKQKQFQAQQQQEQQTQIMHQMALQESIQQQHAQVQAQAFPQTVASFTDPLTGRTAHFYQGKRGDWKPIEHGDFAEAAQGEAGEPGQQGPVGMADAAGPPLAPAKPERFGLHVEAEEPGQSGLLGVGGLIPEAAPAKPAQTPSARQGTRSIDDLPEAAKLKEMSPQERVDYLRRRGASAASIGAALTEGRSDEEWAEAEKAKKAAVPEGAPDERDLWQKETQKTVEDVRREYLRTGRTIAQTKRLEANVTGRPLDLATYSQAMRDDMAERSGGEAVDRPAAPRTTEEAGITEHEAAVHRQRAEQLYGREPEPPLQGFRNPQEAAAFRQKYNQWHKTVNGMIETQNKALLTRKQHALDQQSREGQMQQREEMMKQRAEVRREQTASLEKQQAEAIKAFRHHYGAASKEKDATGLKPAFPTHESRVEEAKKRIQAERDFVNPKPKVSAGESKPTRTPEQLQAEAKALDAAHEAEMDKAQGRMAARQKDSDAEAEWAKTASEYEKAANAKRKALNAGWFRRLLGHQEKAPWEK